MAHSAMTHSTAASVDPVPLPKPVAQAQLLDLLVQPHFFGGQLLTDQDLTQLLKWAQAKLRLNRFRDGWGVVRGLSVRVESKRSASDRYASDHPTYGFIVIEPGYALDANGNDIQVNHPHEIDLNQLPWPDLEPPKIGKVHFAQATAKSFVDLYLYYIETPDTDKPQSPFGRITRLGQDAPEYGRYIESFAIQGEFEARATSVPNRLKDFTERYTGCLQVLEGYNEFVKSHSPGNLSKVRWIVNRIKEHPLHHFPFVHSQCEALINDPKRINEYTNEAFDQRIVQLLFWLVQDRRNSLLAPASHNGEARAGVPLGRVWIERNKVGGVQVCALDTFPPHRRLLSPEGWIAEAGQLNLGQFIWHRPEEVVTQLAAMGLDFTIDSTREFPKTVNDLKDALAGDPFYDFETVGQKDLILWAVNADALVEKPKAATAELSPAELMKLGKRIVGFHLIDTSKSTADNEQVGDQGNGGETVPLPSTTEVEKPQEEKLYPSQDATVFHPDEGLKPEPVHFETQATPAQQMATPEAQEPEAEPEPTEMRLAETIESESSITQSIAADVVAAAIVDSVALDVEITESAQDAETQGQDLSTLDLTTLEITAAETSQSEAAVVDTPEVDPQAADSQAVEDAVFDEMSLDEISADEVSPDEVSPDDFTRISGIGRARADQMGYLGIITFDDLINFSDETLMTQLKVGSSTVANWKSSPRKLIEQS